jgi:predicted nucleotidyltransferase
LSSLQAICRALNEAGVKYLIVGGVAVNAYGYIRATQDLDLVVALAQPNASAAMRVLSKLGYSPRVPVDADEFADPQRRKSWVEEKGMTVFSMFNDSMPETAVDVFVEEPFDFDFEYRAAEVHVIGADVSAPFVNIQTLIRMKQQADRDRDRDDILHLRWILAAREQEDT